MSFMIMFFTFIFCIRSNIYVQEKQLQQQQLLRLLLFILKEYLVMMQNKNA